MKWLYGRAIRLLVPWIIWTIIFCTIRHEGWYGYIYYMFVEPAVWFLPCLFLCNAYLAIMNCFKKCKAFAVILLYFIISVIGIGLNLRIFIDFMIFLPFYMLGLVYRVKISCMLKTMWKNTIMICCTVLYPLSMVVYTFGTGEAAQKAKETIECIGFGNEFLIKTFYWVNSRFIIACLGIGMCAAILKIIYKFCGLVKFLFLWLRS